LSYTRIRKSEIRSPKSEQSWFDAALRFRLWVLLSVLASELSEF